MKKEKGVTLISLMMYLIVLSIIVGVSAQFIKYFYRNTDDITISSDSSQKYTRLLEYISEDINSRNIDSMRINDTNDLILYLKNGAIHEYFYDSTNKEIYYITWLPTDNSLKKEVQLNLCNNVNTCTFVKQSDFKFILTSTINGLEYKNAFTI